MKTHIIFRHMVAVVLMLTAVQNLLAQEAFYIYRNDGKFDGFFYDDVQRMGVSKTDLNGDEHEVYVVQEIQTKDSLYRIPLAAIDSIGFVQPDIIFSENLYEIIDYDGPVHTNGHSCFFCGEDGYTIKWPIDTGDETSLPKAGMVLYNPDWRKEDYTRYDGGPFVGKVVEVRLAEWPDNPYRTKYYDVVCEPITDLGEVFEQLISVEQLGSDENGNARRRIAGINKARRRVSGNRDFTLLNISGSFPFSRGDDVNSVSINLDLSLKVQAQVVYNISRKITYIGCTIKEDAEVGARFAAKYNIEETTTWYLGGAPVYFPSILPIFQINPSPEAFIKSTGDLSLTVSSPKYAYHGTQSFHLGTDGVSGSCVNEFPETGGDDNRWSMELSLNGSLQAGSNFPMKLETNRWAKKSIYAAIGADVYVGPKLSASFSIDVGSLVGADIYNMYKGTNIKLSPICANFEASAIYSFRNKPETKEKFFEGEISALDISLHLFPDFEKVEIVKPPVDGRQGAGGLEAKLKPRGLSVPCVVGLSAYNWKKERVYESYGDVYAFYNTFDEQISPLRIVDGKYSIVPLISMFGVDIPAWGYEVEVERRLLPYYNLWSPQDEDGNGYLYIYNVFPEDKVELELVKSHSADSYTRYVPDEYGNPSNQVAEYTVSYGEPGDKVSCELSSEEEPLVIMEIENRKVLGQRYDFHSMYHNSFSETGRYRETDEYTKRVHTESGTYRFKITREDGHVLYTDKISFGGVD